MPEKVGLSEVCRRLMGRDLTASELERSIRGINKVRWCMGLIRPGEIGATRLSFPLFRCPKCNTVCEIDEDQFHGRVNIQCPSKGCPYHGTKDWSKEAPR